jgi:hypothetical protein
MASSYRATRAFLADLAASALANINDKKLLHHQQGYLYV